MTDEEEDFAPPPPRSRFRRLRKFAFWMLGIVGVIALVLLLGRWQVGRVGEAQLRSENARLDAADPGWKMAAIFAAREKAAPPPEENAANAVLKIAEDIPEDWRKWRNSEDATKWWTRRPGNRHRPGNA